MTARSPNPPPIPRTWCRRRIGLLGLAAVALGAAAVYLHRHDPSVPGSALPECLLHRATGLYCPGCGSTRALHELLHGQWRSAAGHNLLLAAALPAVAILLARTTWRYARGLPADPAPSRLPARWLWGLFAAVMVFWIARNLPGPPFSSLAP